MTTIEQIWNTYSTELRGFIARRTRTAADADDVLQNVFLKIFTRLETLREPEKLRGWLYRIAANAVTDYYRGRKMEVNLPEEIGFVEPPEMNKQGDCFQNIQSCLVPLVNALPVKHKEALSRTALDGWTGGQFAASENISLSGVKSRVQRGRRMIKKMIEDCCLVESDGRGHPIGCEPKKRANIFC